MKENKTAKALKLMEADPDMTVYAAAKAVGITPTTLYAGKMRANKTKVTCPCCGGLVEPSKINREVLKQ
jgi:hypothetical protein